MEKSSMNSTHRTITVYAQATYNEENGFWETRILQIYDDGSSIGDERVDNYKVACGDECVIAAALLEANGMNAQKCLGMDANPIID